MHQPPVLLNFQNILQLKLALYYSFSFLGLQSRPMPNPLLFILVIGSFKQHCDCLSYLSQKFLTVFRQTAMREILK